MANKGSNGKRPWIFPVLLIGALIIGTLGFFFLRQKTAMAAQNWEGSWKVTYYYENEKTLLYLGTLNLAFSDTVSGKLEVFAPLSSKPEELRLAALSLTEKGRNLSGKIVHDQYKIRGGYLVEAFTFTLGAPGSFTGTGRCLEYCAEGTENTRIRWQGTKD